MCENLRLYLRDSERSWEYLDNDEANGSHASFLWRLWIVRDLQQRSLMYLSNSISSRVNCNVIMTSGGRTMFTYHITMYEDDGQITTQSM